MGYKIIIFLLFAKFCVNCFYISGQGERFLYSNQLRTSLEKIYKCANAEGHNLVKNGFALQSMDYPSTT